MSNPDIWPTPWRAVPKNDRLKRWCVLAHSDSPGKPIVADNIRTEAMAKLIAAAPELLNTQRTDK